MTRDRVFILGAGRAGRSLARALRAGGVQVTGLHGRHADVAEGITAGAPPGSLGSATCVLVTVRDAQLEGALETLTTAAIAPAAIVLHASGSVDPTGLGALRRSGHPCGTFHPLVALSDPEHAPQTLRGAWIGIDGDPEARTLSERLAAAVAANVLYIPPGEKARYHAAAVFASNFPTVLMCLAEELLRDAGIASDVARRALHPLFASAVENLRSGAGASALTGPIVRGDADTIARHLDALRTHPDTLDAYRALSRAALRWVREGGTSDHGRLDEIERLLRITDRLPSSPTVA
ncbi:MAG TPA: DUF2520 domain-containing protein [Gemmatimonadaceae bacterium]|nr:DUF2520 domain-containing protein [Gemmatimonadaceae bacterium]